MSENERPDIKVTYTKKYLFIDIFSLLGIILMALAAFVAYRYLPETFPIHFDLAGNSNGYGGPGEFLKGSLMLCAIQLVMWIGFSALRLFPRVYNFPVEITDGNAAVQYKLAVDLLLYLKAGIVFLFMVIEASMIWSAFSGNASYVFAAILLPLILLAYFIISFTRKSLQNR